MSRLIVLNGPPGIGKSTLARMYVNERPLALNLDIDRIRSLLGRWREDPENAGLRARALAVAAARTHLAVSHDVVIPQFIARPEFLDQLATVAFDSNAAFFEVVLIDSTENVLRRFAARSRVSTDPAHIEAAEMLSGGMPELSEMCDRLFKVIAARPHAIIVDSVLGRAEQTYRDVVAALS
jgi:predicted kinase